MRPKYKIWDKQEKKWFEPTYEAYRGKLQDILVSPSGEITMIEMRNGLIELIHESVFPDRFEIVLYTGLKDKNGKEIYEGDRFREGKSIGTIVYEQGRFEINWDEPNPEFWSETLKFHAEHGEVIGTV